MFRGWILHLPLCLFGNRIPPSVLSVSSFTGLSLFHFSVEEGARLLQVLQGLLSRGLFTDQVACVISWCLGLPSDFVTSARFAMNEPRSVVHV